MDVILKAFNPKIDFIMNITLLFSLFYILILIPYSFYRGIVSTSFAKGYISLSLGVFTGYLFLWIYDKVKVYPSE